MSVADDLGTAATAHTAPGAPATRIADRYEVLGLLGTGGMGRVYRARDIELDEVVALKVLRRELAEVPGMLERFRREVKLARRVTHRTWRASFDIGEHARRRQFLTMEFVDGRVARAARSRATGRLSVDARRRDRARGRARGSARRTRARRDASRSQARQRPRRAGRARRRSPISASRGSRRGPSGDRREFVGTPAYMAPEQVEAPRASTRRRLYAFGAILFEMLDRAARVARR